MPPTAIAFGSPSPKLGSLSDEEFLKQIAWGADAPKQLKSSAAAADVAGFSAHLCKNLAAARGGDSSKKALSKLRFPTDVFWSQHAFDESPRTDELFDICQTLAGNLERSAPKNVKKRARVGKKKHTKSSARAEWQKTFARIEGWLAGAGNQSPIAPLELLVLLELLDRLSGLPGDTCLFKLWRIALSASIELAAQRGAAEEGDTAEDQRLLVEGELPWKAGLLFSAVRGAGKLGSSGNRVLDQQLLDMTDTDGTPNADLLERMSFWLAPLVRAEEWANRYETTLWDDDSADRFEQLLEAGCSFCRTDGRLALSNGFRHDVVGLLASGSRLAGWKKKSLPLRYVMDVARESKKHKRPSRKTHVRPAISTKKSSFPVRQSDWARLACLRNHWAVNADTLVVAHHGAKPQIDLTILGTPVLSGVWDIDVHVDGKALPFDAESEWDCSCWFSDRDADYLEIQLSFDDGSLIDRQLLLSRRDHFLVMADVITNSAGARIEYSSSLPVIDGVRIKQDRLSRECTLKAAGTPARIFPAALDADRIMSANGSFGEQAGQLRLEQKGVGGLYAPLVIDWAPHRSRSYAEWRTLTITEQGRAVTADSAAGHRLRIGDHQLFIYRKLQESDELRACLGFHTSNESVIGTFDSGGDVEALLIVE